MQSEFLKGARDERSATVAVSGFIPIPGRAIVAMPKGKAIQQSGKATVKGAGGVVKASRKAASQEKGKGTRKAIDKRGNTGANRP